MKYLLILAAISLASCTKPKTTGITIYTGGSATHFQTCTLSVQPFCGPQNIYSFTSGKDVLISIVATSLVPGTYKAGINYWGHFTDNINLQMQPDGSATFYGTICSGSINQ